MTRLGELIRSEIQRGGPVSFERFMERALYHPEHGYYLRDKDPFGKQGDFFTNSQMQPVFGRFIARQIEQWRREMGSPPEFTVVELGAGRGETLAEVKKALPDVECIAVERGTGPLPGGFTGVVYSNEFFDALPVRVVEKRGAILTELLVGLDEERFGWLAVDTHDAALEQYVDRYAPGLSGGQRLEVNLQALHELERIAGALERGYVLTIDYGYTAEEIAAGRRFPQGSLMAYQSHQALEDVLTEPGECDITAHVNFTALEERGRDLGLDSLGLRTQARFLLDLGEGDQFASVLAGSEVEALQLRLQLKSLLIGMGETFRVLVQRK
ncbi:MAG: SAM-dependent methyltransferase [Acidobacteria bacterium]|nr:SAM-dependent methyltransferase [Acidobacteriota bacterium]